VISVNPFYLEKDRLAPGTAFGIEIDEKVLKDNRLIDI
jgi:hypothetical protein